MADLLTQITSMLTFLLTSIGSVIEFIVGQPYLLLPIVMSVAYGLIKFGRRIISQ